MDAGKNPGRQAAIEFGLWAVLLFYIVPVMLGFGWDLVRQFRIQEPGKWYYSGARIQHGFSAYDPLPARIDSNVDTNPASGTFQDPYFHPEQEEKPCPTYAGMCEFWGNDVISQFFKRCWDWWYPFAVLPSIEFLESGWNVVFAIPWVPRVFLYVLLATLAYATKKAADLLVEEWVVHIRTKK